MNVVLHEQSESLLALMFLYARFQDVLTGSMLSLSVLT